VLGNSRSSSSGIGIIFYLSFDFILNIIIFYRYVLNIIMFLFIIGAQCLDAVYLQLNPIGLVAW